jgi:hypothetical protein
LSASGTDVVVVVVVLLGLVVLVVLVVVVPARVVDVDVDVVGSVWAPTVGATADTPIRTTSATAAVRARAIATEGES